MNKLLYLVLCFAIGWLISYTSYNSGVQTNGLKAPPVNPLSLEQEPELLAIAEQLGIDVSLVNLRYGETTSTNIKDTTRTMAVFYPPNNIEVRRDTQDKRLAIAHEYIHYIHTRLDEPNKQAIEQMYLAGKEMKHNPVIKRMVDYNCDNRCMSNEYLAYLCTEIPNYALRTEAVIWCLSFIPNRDILF